MCEHKFIDWLHDTNIEATTIRFVLEGNIDIFICSLLAIINSRNNKSLGDKFQDKFSTVYAYLFLGLLLYAPVHALFRAL